MRILRVVAVVCLLPALLGTGACGGGGGDDGGGDPLALLEGTWLGRTLGGQIQVTFAADGTITQVLRNGIDAGETGSLQHVGGAYFEGQIVGGDELRLFLDPTASYGTLFSVALLAAIQKNATAIPPDAVALADIAPGDYDGTNLTLGAGGRPVAEALATAAIAADGILTGFDAVGFTFGSAPAQPLEALGTFFEGSYRDSAHPTTGFMDLIPSPDSRFLAAASFPATNGSLANAAFVGAWLHR